MNGVQELLIVGWLCLTGAGIGLTIYMVVVSVQDLRNLENLGLNGELEALSRLSIWQEARRFIIKMVFFLLGISGLIESVRRPDVASTRDAYGWVSVILLYTVVSLMNYSSVAAIRFRKHFIATKISNDPRSSKGKGEQGDA